MVPLNSQFLSTLVKLVLPAVTTLLILFAARRRGISWGDGLGFTRPKATMLAGWVGLWIVWILATEALIRIFGLEQAKAWPHYSPTILVMRISAIAFLGPLCEEVVMRGLIFGLLRRSAVGWLGAVTITAVLWAAAHYRYRFVTVLLITVDGMLLGLARYKGGSLWLPITMHSLGNMISICQSLAAAHGDDS